MHHEAYPILIVGAGLIAYLLSQLVFEVRCRIGRRGRLERWQRRAQIDGEGRGFPVEVTSKDVTARTRQ